MAGGRNAGISITITGDADLGAARKDIARDLDKIEDLADDTADEIKRAFADLSPELDTTEIRKALDLAAQLDGMVATFDIDTDISEIQEAEKLAKALRSFQAKVDLSVEGRAELAEALNLSEKVEGIRRVKVEVEGRQDLEKAAQIADDLERRRTIPIDAQASDLQRLDDQITAAGAAGADGVESALGDIDFENIGQQGLDQLTGALSAAGPWAALAGSVAVVFAEPFIEGFTEKINSKSADIERALRTGLNPEELGEVGRVGGEVFADGLAEGLTTAKDAAVLLQAELGRVDDDFDLSEVTRQSLAIEKTFGRYGVELEDVVVTAQKLVKLELFKDPEDAFNALFDLFQQVGPRAGEALEVVTEFSSSFDSLGIQGPQALALVGASFEKNIFEQTDQAGEVFSEFNEIIRTGGAAEALQEIGLNAGDMQKALADGRGADVMATIATRLLNVEDGGERAALAAELFGSNIALASDPDAALEIYAQANAFTVVSDNASEAADKLEETATGMDKLKGVVTGLGGAIAEGLGGQLSLLTGDFASAGEAARNLAADLVNPLGAVERWTGLDLPDNSWLGDWSDKVRNLGVDTEETSTKLAHQSDQFDKTKDAAFEAAGAIDHTGESVDQLQQRLEGLFAFGFDQSMREIAEAGDELTAMFEEGAAKAVGFNGEIDISTEAGRDLQQQLEGMNGTLKDLATQLANGEITTDQYKAATSELTGQLERTTSAAGVTTDKVGGLERKYLDVEAIGEIDTKFTADTQGAYNNVTTLQSAIDRIKSKSITISASISGPTGVSASGTFTRKARGGWTDGLTLVGEEGPELIDVKGRAFVHTAAETRDILSNRGGDLVGAPGVGRGRAFIENATFVVDRGVDLWQQADLAEQVYGSR